MTEPLICTGTKVRIAPRGNDRPWTGMVVALSPSTGTAQIQLDMPQQSGRRGLGRAIRYCSISELTVLEAS